MIVAVDFDGTIVEEAWPKIGKAKPEMISLLKSLKKRGHTIILWTCRYGEDLEKAIIFCEKYGIEFDAVNQGVDDFMGESPKIYADIYIDDRALGVKDQKKIMKRLLEE